MLDALAKESPRSTGVFEDLFLRLSRIENDGERLNLLNAEWEKSGPPSLFIFENTESIVSSPVFSSYLTRWLNTAPLSRRIAVCSRVPLPLRASRYLPPHRLLKIDADDLALTAQEASDLLQSHNVDARYCERDH